MFQFRLLAQIYVRNCVEAILKLISNKLLIPHPRIPNQFIRITIIANQIPSSIVNIDISTNLQAVLKKRFQGKCINLSNFHSDAGLTEFCVLSQPKLMLYVMQFVSELKPPPTKLIFSDNFLRSLEAINVLGTDEVRSIDLRNNELATKEALEPLKKFYIIGNHKIGWKSIV
ncbi:hypothetical protein NQ318_000536 [Aromia moschata]|uniref:Uncharacterized protein n=1 Tax=Aromia moschata TaxID=1265417 RepID=A0AAV8YGZ1_9CUCU|nr:hypothetical protein NQ318_000536 [Aromia moschata]